MLGEDNEVYECRLRGIFRNKGIKTTNPIAVGDYVSFEFDEEHNAGLIRELEPRKNYIIRKSVNLSKQAHIIGANMDQSILIVTLRDPVTSYGFIDRFLASLEAYRVPGVLVFNKVDIYTDDDLDELEFRMAMYGSMGYKCFQTSAETGEGIEKLKASLIDKTSLFSGHSGVGKSTLINAIQPGMGLKTSEVSQSHSKGQHTTTFAELFLLHEGGSVIDTPGIKGFGMVDMKVEEVADYFRDFFTLLPNCKFNNCKHLNEPGCAVLEAIDENRLSPTRYQSYLSILEELEEKGPYR